MLKHLGIFAIFAVCLFALAMGGCDEPMQKMLPPATETATVPPVLIYTGDTWWITQEAARAEAETTRNLLRSAGISAKITEDEDSVREWMLQTAADNRVNVLILYGILPPSIYPEGNTQPDGSVAEQWIETSDGNTLLNHADYFGFNYFANGEEALQNLMDIPGISIPRIDYRHLPMDVTATGAALTPSLVNFGSDRPLPLSQLQGGWVAEKVLASHTSVDGEVWADPVVVRDGNRGRIALLHQTQDQDNPKGEVAAELIINYLLAEFAEGEVPEEVEKIGVEVWEASADPSLMLYFSFDELNGTQAIDHSQHQNHGTLVGNPVLVEGKFGKALEFNGESDYVEVPHDDSLTVDQNVTVMAWIHTPRHHGPKGMLWQGIIAKGNDPRSYSFYTEDGGALHLSVNNFFGRDSEAKVALNEWQHVVAQVDNGVHRYWINGKNAGVHRFTSDDETIDSEGQTSLPGTTDRASVRVGNTHDVSPLPDRHFLGRIDEVRVWNRALSEAEILEQMNMGSSGTAANP